MFSFGIKLLKNEVWTPCFNRFVLPRRTAKFVPLTEEEVFDSLTSGKDVQCEREVEFNCDILNKKNKDVIIKCKNPSLNHYKNQKYDKLSPIPLASKGWHHYKSKGDYFSIQVSNNEDFIDNWFWSRDVTDFSQFNLSPSLINALEAIGIKRPTNIQTIAIPALMRGRNSLMTAETGCGKTLAYLIPLIQQILKKKENLPIEREPNQPLGIIIVPSRDLALQIGDIAKKLSYLLPFRCNVLVGGRTKKKIMDPHFEQIDLQIASLGSFSKLCTVGMYDLSEVGHVVLDEADSLMDDSFNETLVHLMKKIKIRFGPSSELNMFGSQLTLVSATIPTSLQSILGHIVEIDSLQKIDTGRIHRVLPHVHQTFYRLGGSQKPSKLLQLVKESQRKKEQIMIFSNKKITCDWVSLMLNENNIACENLNGAMPEILRRGKFSDFQDGQIMTLSCTDIGSRGLDTIKVGHVINFDFPLYIADYIHRCGRVGRVGSSRQSKISNFISSTSAIELVKKIEMSVRTMENLPNVNANIKKIIYHKILKSH